MSNRWLFGEETVTSASPALDVPFGIQSFSPQLDSATAPFYLRQSVSIWSIPVVS